MDASVEHDAEQGDALADVTVVHVDGGADAQPGLVQTAILTTGGGGRVSSSSYQLTIFFGAFMPHGSSEGAKLLELGPATMLKR